MVSFLLNDLVNLILSIIPFHNYNLIFITRRYAVFLELSYLQWAVPIMTCFETSRF